LADIVWAEWLASGGRYSRWINCRRSFDPVISRTVRIGPRRDPASIPAGLDDGAGGPLSATLKRFRRHRCQRLFVDALKPGQTAARDPLDASHNAMRPWSDATRFLSKARNIRSGLLRERLDIEAFVASYQKARQEEWRALKGEGARRALLRPERLAVGSIPGLFERRHKIFLAFAFEFLLCRLEACDACGNLFSRTSEAFVPFGHGPSFLSRVRESCPECIGSCD
jgi:hypothetical protein